MKVIKKINNNVALCLDGNQRELIAFGKGIGFKPIPYELTDLSVIERTYYGISPEYQGLLKEIPKEIFDVSGMLVDLAANSIDADFNRNLVITLADHINFAIDRYKKNIHIKPPYVGNLAYLHEAEYKVATQAVACINQRFGVRLPKEEAAAIALHLINAENSVAPKADSLDASTMISDVIGLIEKRENITIDRSGFNASRFITHMEYLLARIRNNETLENNNDKLFNNLKQEYRETYLCAEDVRTYLQQKTGKNLGSEEMSYLMLHIERFCSREQA